MADFQPSFKAPPGYPLAASQQEAPDCLPPQHLMWAWRAELIQVSSSGQVPLTATPSHGTIPCWPEAQLPPSLKGDPTPQVEKLRGRVAKQLPPPN